MPQNELLYAPAMTKMSWQNAFTTVSSWLITDGVNLSVNNINSQPTICQMCDCTTLFMVALCNREDHIYFHAVVCSSFFFFFFVSWQRYCTASSSGHQPNFAALNRGRHLYSAGRPSRWALAHISSSFFSSPNLSRCRFDVCHTSTHGVALVQI